MPAFEMPAVREARIYWESENILDKGGSDSLVVMLPFL
jgi:hypothetical protein